MDELRFILEYIKKHGDVVDCDRAQFFLDKLDSYAGPTTGGVSPTTGSALPEPVAGEDGE